MFLMALECFCDCCVFAYGFFIAFDRVSLHAGVVVGLEGGDLHDVQCLLRGC